MLFLVNRRFRWRCKDDVVLAGRAVQPADDRESAGIRGHRHSDACLGDWREHHDLQLDQLNLIESNSGPGEPAGGSGAIAQPAFGNPISVHLSRRGRHARRAAKFCGNHCEWNGGDEPHQQGEPGTHLGHGGVCELFHRSRRPAHAGARFSCPPKRRSRVALPWR